MFCYKCGAQLQDDACFCPKCGSKRIVAPAPEEPQVTTSYVNPAPEEPQVTTSYVNPAPEEPQVNTNYVNPAPAAVTEPTGFAPSFNKARAVVASLIRSPIFLIATIAFTLLWLLNLPGLFDASYIDFGPTRYIYQLLQNIRNTFRIYEYFYVFDFLFGWIGHISYLLVFIFDLLIVIGLWITYGSAGQNGQRLRTGGLTLIKVSTILNMAWNCLLLTILFISAISGLFDYYGNLTFSLVVLFIAPPVLVIEILYSAKICSSLSAAKNAITTGISNSGASIFVAIILILKLGQELLRNISDFIQAMLRESLDAYISSFTFESISWDFLTFAIWILMGILIFQYRSKMSKEA